MGLSRQPATPAMQRASIRRFGQQSSAWPSHPNRFGAADSLAASLGRARTATQSALAGGSRLNLFNDRIFVQRDTTQLAVVFGEMDRDHHNVIFRDAIGGQ